MFVFGWLWLLPMFLVAGELEVLLEITAVNVQAQ